MRGRAADTAGATALPSDLRGAYAVALEKVLVRVFLSDHRVLRRRGVFAAEREWIDAHLLGELVDRRLERERSLDVPRCAERRERTRVGDDLVRLR